MITVTFQAPTREKLEQLMVDWLQPATATRTQTAPLPIEGSTRGLDAGCFRDIEGSKRGPGRPKKETPAPPVVVENQTEIPGPPMEVKAEVVIPAHTPTTVAPVQSGPVDLDAVKAAVKKLTEHREGDNSTHDSIKRAVVVLGKFGATTIKELKPEQYAAFVAACQAA